MEYLNQLLAGFKELDANGVVMSAISTCLLIVVVVILRAIVARAIRRNENLQKEIRRRWLVQLRNGALLVILLGVVIIWAEELRLVAVSVIAVAVATVIATKELIQCLSGSVLKSVSRPFKIGDRIEISSLRGDVIDTSALTTTIMEIGPQQLTQQLTGRSIVLPNSMFLDKPVINETFTQEYVLHVFKVPVEMEDWQQAEHDLIEAAKSECAPFLDEARKHFESLGEHEGLVTLSVDPRVTVTIPKAGEVELVVRIAVPARKKGRVEQAILRRFLVLAGDRAAEQKEQTAPAETDVASRNGDTSSPSRTGSSI